MSNILPPAAGGEATPATAEPTLTEGGGTGLWKDAFRRPRRNPHAIAGAVIIGLFLLVAAGAFAWIASRSICSVTASGRSRCDRFRGCAIGATSPVGALGLACQVAMFAFAVLLALPTGRRRRPVTATPGDDLAEGY